MKKREARRIPQTTVQKVDIDTLEDRMCITPFDIHKESKTPIVSKQKPKIEKELQSHIITRS